MQNCKQEKTKLMPCHEIAIFKKISSRISQYLHNTTILYYIRPSNICKWENIHRGCRYVFTLIAETKAQCWTQIHLKIITIINKLKLSWVIFWRQRKERKSEAYYNQSVHNIFTCLQAGCTRHLQEQLFGRLLDL